MAVTYYMATKNHMAIKQGVLQHILHKADSAQTHPSLWRQILPWWHDHKSIWWPTESQPQHKNVCPVSKQWQEVMVVGLWRHADDAAWMPRLLLLPQRMQSCKKCTYSRKSLCCLWRQENFSWMGIHIHHHPSLTALIAVPPETARGVNCKVIYTSPQFRCAGCYFHLVVIIHFICLFTHKQQAR